MSREMIIQTVNQMALAVDLRDWALCRRCFAAEVLVDYTSLVGGEPATTPAEALIDSWRGLLPGFTATQHLLGSHVIEMGEGEATCRAHFQAVHLLDDERWLLGGHYHFRLQNDGGAWQIAAITMTALWSVGDQARLLQRAAERAAALA